VRAARKANTGRIEKTALAGLKRLHYGTRRRPPGCVGDWENTYCVTCGERLIRRYGYRIVDYKITSEGRCPSCFSSVPGRWAHSFRRQITDHPLLPVMARDLGK
jgi:hypothetical protein